MNELGDELTRLVREEAGLRREERRLEARKRQLSIERVNREEVLACLGLTEEAAQRVGFSFPREELEKRLYEELRSSHQEEVEINETLAALRKQITVNQQAQEEAKKQIQAGGE